MVGWMMIGAGAFGSVFSGLGGNALVANIAINMPGGPNMVFFVAGAFVFLLGLFLEPGALIFIVAPIIAPILSRLGFEPLFVGLAFNIILQTAYMTPPFGFTLFYVLGVAPKDVTIIELYKAAAPFVVIQIISAVLFFMFPQVVLWLPRYLFG